MADAVKEFELGLTNIKSSVILAVFSTIIRLDHTTGNLSYQPTSKMLADLVGEGILSAGVLEGAGCWLLHLDAEHEGGVMSYSSEVTSTLLWKLSEQQHNLSEAVAGHAGTTPGEAFIPMAVQIFANPPHSTGQRPLHVDQDQHSILYNMMLNLFHDKTVDASFGATVVKTVQPALNRSNGIVFDSGVLHGAGDNATDNFRYLLNVSWFRCEETQDGDGRRTWRLPYFPFANTAIPRKHRERYAHYSNSTIRYRNK
mmetsp:Transcript_7791/g.12280  ORF Transcript_7791/g.12280 Transcript_7791/m.12280 type:complete len:256 (+) Transcript_7791:204-971(+)